MELRVPSDVSALIERLRGEGHEAFVVGGCVRDALRGTEPGDWDLATGARPEEIQRIFPRSVYANRFGTVVVRTRERDVEVTTYRIEADYADHRRPDHVRFTDSLRADLSRRDFTINAMAWRPPGELVDPFGGAADLERRIVRAVGDPEERVREDALRMLRAVRFATTLGMAIEPGTANAIERCAHLAVELSGERIGAEMTKIVLSERPSVGLRLLADLGLLAVLAPELEECRTVPQEKAYAQDVFEHSLLTVDAVAEPDLVLRLAALLHDVGKPRTFGDGHFHQHEFVGEHLARTILRRWKYPKETITAVAHLVRNHMFWYQQEWTPAAVRRFIRKVGLDEIPRLFELRRADNVGSGARAPRMYALDELWRRVQEEIAGANAFSPRDLEVDGNDVMAALGIPSGPEVGRIIRELFERVLDDPSLNEREALLRLAREIHRPG
ncbi:MAG TPA: HD domain-containing protein [Candidatus Limnocylindria bacterium]|nr:HD domain-containing protein [Candidatus Limnocylindria bacterium]